MTPTGPGDDRSDVTPTGPGDGRGDVTPTGPGDDRSDVTPTGPGDDLGDVTPTGSGVTPSGEGLSASADSHLDVPPEASADAPDSGLRRSKRFRRKPSWFTLSVILIIWVLSWFPL